MSAGRRICTLIRAAVATSVVWLAAVPVRAEGTATLFRGPGVWQYRGYIFVALMLLLAQSLLIAALLIQAARRRRAEQQLQASQAELRASYERVRDLGGRLLRAQEDERARISRELHDDISQQIAVLGIDLAMLEGSPLRGGERLVTEAYERTQAVARRVRDLSHRLHPSNLSLIGLSRALGRLARDFAQAGLTMTFACRFAALTRKRRSHDAH